MVTLPAASAFPAGATLTVIDESGNCSATKTITVTRAGSDSLVGTASVDTGTGVSIALMTPYAHVTLESNGVSQWTIVSASLAAQTTLRSDAIAGAGSSALVIAGNVNCERFEIQSNIQPQFQGYLVGTSVDSPTGVLSGGILFGLAGGGFNGAARTNPFAAALIQIIAEENWTPTANGARISFKTVAPGLPTSGNLIERFRISGAGQSIFFGAQADQSKVDNTPTTGFAITIGNTTATLRLTPAGALATGTVTLPAAPVDGQIARVLSSQTVTALTVSPSAGQSVVGAPSTVGPTTPFSMIYDLASATWYRMS